MPQTIFTTSGGGGGAGAWAKTTAKSAELNEPESVEARTENGGKVCRMKGIYEVAAAKEVKANETICKLPAGCAPTTNREMGIPTTAGTVKVVIETGGNISVRTALAATVQILFGSFSFPIE